MADGIILPLIVSIDGEQSSAALMNRKAFSKNVESKKLWIVYPETGRVLLWAGDTAYASLSEEDVEAHENIQLGSERGDASNILYKLAETIKSAKRRCLPVPIRLTFLRKVLIKL